MYYETKIEIERDYDSRRDAFDATIAIDVIDDAIVIAIVRKSRDATTNVREIDFAIDDATIDALTNAKRERDERNATIDNENVRNLRIANENHARYRASIVARIETIDRERESLRDYANATRAYDDDATIVKRDNAIDRANAYRNDERESLIASIDDDAIDDDRRERIARDFD